MQELHGLLELLVGRIADRRIERRYACEDRATHLVFVLRVRGVGEELTLLLRRFRHGVELHLLHHDAEGFVECDAQRVLIVTEHRGVDDDAGSALLDRGLRFGHWGFGALAGVTALGVLTGFRLVIQVDEVPGFLIYNAFLAFHIVQ